MLRHIMLKDERGAKCGRIIHTAPLEAPEISEFDTEINGIKNDSLLRLFAVVINTFSLEF